MSTKIRSLFGRLLAKASTLMSDRQPSTFSAISPKKPDGTQGPIFPRNGNGQSR